MSWLKYNSYQGNFYAYIATIIGTSVSNQDDTSEIAIDLGVHGKGFSFSDIRDVFFYVYQSLCCFFIILIDNLNLVYDGNQLQSVKDNATYSVFGNDMEFKDGANQTIEYTYDKNGNLTKDLYKNISVIQYNLLNLPSQVSFTGGNVIEYEYGADGKKLRTVCITNGVTSTIDYL